MHPITLRMLGAGSLIRLERLSSRCNTNPAQRGHKKNERKVNIDPILTQYWLFGVFFQCLARPLPVRPVAVWCRSVKLFAPNLFSWGLASTKKGYRLSIVHRSVSGTTSVVRSSINPRPSFHTSSFDIRWVFGEWLIGLGRRSIDNR